jgi:uncharacterized protein HemY
MAATTRPIPITTWALQPKHESIGNKRILTINKHLTIYIEFNDRHSQAKIYHNLGRLAQAQRQWEQANTRYQQALAIYIEFDDRHSQAGTYGQLGNLAQEQQAVGTSEYSLSTSS